jgi:autophagy-related protein 2
MQAFESVIPSERTRVAVKVMDGSIRALAPSHPGAVVLYVGELDFATDIVGDSPEMSFHLSIPSISLLLIDNLLSVNESAAMKPPRTHSASEGIGHWKVRSMGDLAP